MNPMNPRIKFLLCHGVLGYVASTAARDYIFRNVAKFRNKSVYAVPWHSSVERAVKSACLLIFSLYWVGTAVAAIFGNATLKFFQSKTESDGVSSSVSSVVPEHVVQVAYSCRFSSDWVERHLLTPLAPATLRSAANKIGAPHVYNFSAATPALVEPNGRGSFSSVSACESFSNHGQPAKFLVYDVVGIGSFRT